MFPRPNKYGHAAAFSVIMGKMTDNGYQKPATALVCNFPKPTALLEKMIAAKNINSGTKALQQVFYGIYDFSLNDGYDPDGNKSTTDMIKELKNDVTLYPYQEGTHQQASFGHLNGYGAAYYGYKWSEVYAHDMFSIFKTEGILNPKTGLKYRRIILEKGGTEEPLDLVRKFLGREPNSNAFLRSMGI